MKAGWKTAAWVGTPFVVWIVLAMLGLPGPHPCDDLVFVPPAIEWAKGHAMHNPQLHQFLAMWGMHTDRWFVHGPVYPLILGLWLRVCGISSVAMLGFQAATNCATQLGFWTVSRRLGLHPAWTWAAAAIYFCATLAWGMRPEAVAFCFLLIGAGFVFGSGAGSSFLAGLFLAGAAVCLPQAAIYAALLMAAFAAANLGAALAHRRDRIRLLCLLAGCLPAVMAFHWGISGDWRLFLTDYRHHLQVGLGLDKSRMDIFSAYVAFYSFGLEWVKGIFELLEIGICAWGMLRLPSRLARYGLAAILLASALNVCTAIPGPYRVAFLNAVLGVTSLAVWSALQPCVAWVRPLCALGVAGVPLLLALPVVVGILAGERTNAAAIAQQLASGKGRLIYCDSAAAWDVFDWHLPDSVQSLHLNREFAGHDLPPGALVIEQEDRIDPHPLRLFGHLFHSVPLNQRRYRLRPVEAGR